MLDHGARLRYNLLVLDLAALERALLADDPRLPCGEHPADRLVAPIGELRCSRHLGIEMAA